jgi:dTDP-4-amino-4,6-dideoxygalactose transaminase
VAVHFGGLPVDLRRLRPRPRVVIEDAAHALGALTPDGPVGNCAHSDMTVFSFHPVKPVTTGEGGAVTTNSDAYATRLRRFRNHGMIPKPEHGDWYYEIEEIGFNYRLSDIHAALGRSQLRKLEGWVARRNELAARYRSLLADLPIQLPAGVAAGFRHAYHLFPVQVPDRRRVFDELRALGIGVQVHYIPLYRHPAYMGNGRPEDFPGVERAYAGLLSLPLFPSLRDEEQAAIVDALHQVL